MPREALAHRGIPDYLLGGEWVGAAQLKEVYSNQATDGRGGQRRSGHETESRQGKDRVAVRTTRGRAGKSKSVVGERALLIGPRGGAYRGASESLVELDLPLHAPSCITPCGAPSHLSTQVLPVASAFTEPSSFSTRLQAPVDSAGPEPGVCSQRGFLKAVKCIGGEWVGVRQTRLPRLRRTVAASAPAVVRSNGLSCRASQAAPVCPW